MELTKEQIAFYSIWKLQGVSDYQIAIYLTLLKDNGNLTTLLDWIGSWTRNTKKFPTESDLVEKIHQVLRNDKKTKR